MNTNPAIKLVRDDFFDDTAWERIARADAYRFSLRVAKQGGCAASGLQTLRQMMRGNALEAVAAARLAKARKLRLAA